MHMLHHNQRENCNANQPQHWVLGALSVFLFYMTGRYPIHTGLQSRNFQAPQPHGLNLNFTLLPEQLQKYGYDTHMIGESNMLSPCKSLKVIDKIKL